MEDLERGPEDLGLQRMPTGEFNERINEEKTAVSRKKFEERLRADSEKPLTSEKVAKEFDRGNPETREKKEREGMIEEDANALRNEYFESEMEPWGEKGENGGKRRKTHRKKHYKKKTYKKHRKTSRKHKKRSSKRCTKKYRK
jgi:hypothetical protein